MQLDILSNERSRYRRVTPSQALRRPNVDRYGEMPGEVGQASRGYQHVRAGESRKDERLSGDVMPNSMMPKWRIVYVVQYVISCHA